MGRGLVTLTNTFVCLSCVCTRSLMSFVMSFHLIPCPPFPYIVSHSLSQKCISRSSTTHMLSILSHVLSYFLPLSLHPIPNHGLTVHQSAMIYFYSRYCTSVKSCPLGGMEVLFTNVTLLLGEWWHVANEHIYLGPVIITANHNSLISF